MKNRLAVTNIPSALVASGLQALSQFFIMASISRIGGTAELGIYALGLAIVAPIMIISAGGMRNIISTDHLVEFSFSHYASYRTVTSLIAVVIVLVAACIVDFSIKFLVISTLIALNKVVEFRSEVVNAHRYRESQIVEASVSIGLRNLLSAALFVVAYYLSKSLLIAIGCGLIGSLISYQLTDHSFAKRETLLNALPEWGKLRDLAKTAIPLGVAVGCISLITNIPRIQLEKAGGVESLGEFSLLAYLVTAGGIAVNSIAQVISPSMARDHLKGNYKRMLNVLFSSLLIFALFAVLVEKIANVVGADIMGMLFGSAGRLASAHLAYVVWAGFFVYFGAIINASINAIRAFHVHLPVALWGVAFSFIISLSIIHGLSPEEPYIAWVVISAGYTIVAILVFAIECYRVSRKSNEAFKTN